MDQNQTKRPNVDSVITSPPARPPFEKTSSERGNAKMEPTSAICPTKYTPNTRMKICQCLARRKKLDIPSKFPPEARFKPTGGRLSQRLGNSSSPDGQLPVTLTGDVKQNFTSPIVFGNCL